MSTLLLGALPRASSRVFRMTARCLADASVSKRAISSAPGERKTGAPLVPPPFPTVAHCPPPTCTCAATPEMPEGLEIDRTSPLNGVITSYSQHVLVCTGKDDWPSRIEEDDSGDNLAADLRELFGRGGRYSDPYHNVSVLNSSFPSTPMPGRTEVQSTSVYILPSFKYVPVLPRVSFEHVDALARGYLLPEKLHPAHDAMSPVHRDRLVRQPAYQRALWGVTDVRDVLVLICGHGGRDRRCGIYGPLLRAEFARLLPHFGVAVRTGPVEVPEDAGPATLEAPPTYDADGSGRGGVGDASSGSQQGSNVAPSARVGLISHIGGHKFAGNVIVYLPPGLRDEQGAPHPLAGHGIWYGRVEPRHVEGIIRETIRKGAVVKDLFRGGITEDSKILRL